MSDQIAMFDAPKFKPHPAKWSDALLELLRQKVPKGVVLDPFGGTGKLGLLGYGWTVISSELEPEWMIQGRHNRCAASIRADALSLPFRTDSIPCIVTSPAYGNRMADDYAGGDKRSDETRNTYRIKLGRSLSKGSGAALQWGPEYRQLHERVCREFRRVISYGGVVFINMKDHFRNNEHMPVTQWWRHAMMSHGFYIGGEWRIELRGDNNTQRARANGIYVVEHETIMKFTTEERT